MKNVHFLLILSVYSYKISLSQSSQRFEQSAVETKFLPNQLEKSVRFICTLYPSTKMMTWLSDSIDMPFPLYFLFMLNGELNSTVLIFNVTEHPSSYSTIYLQPQNCSLFKRICNLPVPPLTFVTQLHCAIIWKILHFFFLSNIQLRRETL